MTSTRIRGIAKAMLVFAAVVVIATIATLATALSNVTATDVAPNTIKASSGQVSVFGVNLTTNAALTDTLTSAKVVFDSDTGFSGSDIAATSAGSGSGVALYRDNGSVADALDGSDTLASSGYSFDTTTCPCTATLTISNSTIPTASEGAYTYIVVIRSSSTISNGDAFDVTLPQDAFTTSPSPTTLSAPNGVTGKTITADTVAPAVPTVANLGLMRAAGKVRSGSSAASDVSSGVLEVLRSSSPLCNTGVVSVTEGPLRDLTSTNADLVGSTAGQVSALQAFPTGSTYVCYRVRDEAGNLSPIAADGTVPGAPSSTDVALLSASNASGAKRVYAAVDASGPRTFRLYIRPGGSGADRSKSDAGNFVDVVTDTGTVKDSGTTNITRFSDDSALAASDGIAYALVNANGNDGALRDDGTIPAAPVSGDLTLLGTSAAAGHQRITAAQDTAARTFGLYVDPAGGSAWTRGVTSSGGTTPVRVTTSASAAAASATTSVFSGTTALAATHSVGYVLLDAVGGNESGVTSDGAIPGPPNVGEIAFSGARKIFTVSTDPYPATTSFSLYVGADDSTASSAYDGTPDGVATSNTPVSVASFAGDSKLFYTRTDTSNGNESAAAQDGTIPPAPSAAIDILSTSAVAGHQVIYADADASGPRTFRLYVDPTGAETPVWLRAFTTSGGTTPVTITTDSLTAQDSSGLTVAIFSGSSSTTALADGHSVGFAYDDADGNESIVAQDGAIPAKPVASATRASDAEDKIYVPTATATNNVNVFFDSDSNPVNAYVGGPDATAASSPHAFGADIPEEYVFYTSVNTTSGNESTMTSDGVVPAPDGSLTAVMSASAASTTITANLDPSGPRLIALYGDPLGATAYVPGVTTSGGSTPVTVTSATDVSVESDPGIYFGTTAIGSGASLAYSVTNENGNDSDLTADGTIPAAPADADLFYASAAAGRAFIDATAPTEIYRVFAGTTPIAYASHSTGTGSEIVHEFAASDAVGWAITDGTSFNESPVLADGTIPAAPAAGTTSASARTSTLTATAATATDNVLAFVTSETDPALVYDEGADLTLTSASPGSFSLSAADLLYYMTRNTVSDNESALTADGDIPAAPTLPAATSLVLAGDGGAGAPAATINSVGAAATKLRPGVALTASGQGVSLRVSKGAVVFGTATSISGSSVTPVFGGTTSGVTYGSTDQNGTTGSLDLSSLDDGSDVAVAGSFTNGNGNESALSSAVNLTKDTTAPAAPSANSITPTSPSTNSKPTVTGTVDGGTVSVTVTFDATGTANDRTFTVTPSSGTYTVNAATFGTNGLADGTYLVTAAAKDAVGNPATATVDSAYIVDLTAPSAPAVPDMTSGTDTGASSTDNITKEKRPAFTIGSVENGATVTLLNGTTAIGSVASTGTSVTITANTDLSDGVHQIKARQTDAAGNVSAISSALAVTIDTAAPTATFLSPEQLTDAGTFDFSEKVTGPTSANVVLRASGSSTNLPASVTCTTGAGTPVSCASVLVETVTLKPTARQTPGESYNAIAALTGQAPINDLAGNPMAQLTRSFRGSRIEEENSPAATPVWGYVRAAGALGGTYRQERSFRSMAIFRGTGSYFVWYTVTGPDMGKADVWIDAVKVGTWDQYSPTVKYGVTRAFRLSPGLHTFVVVAQGQKSSRSTDTKVAVDAIQLDGTVLTTPPLEFRLGSLNVQSASGGVIMQSDLYGAQMNFTFKGTGVLWYSYFGPDRGQAIVYIDGVSQGIFDNYRGRSSIGYYRFSGLSDGLHTIQIVGLGKRSAGTGNWVSVDKWWVL